VNGRSTPAASLVACPQCDLLQRLPELALRTSARCPRCGFELWRRRVDPLHRPFALSVAGAALFVVANCVPMLGLTAVGRHATTTVLGGVAQLWHDDEKLVAVLVLFTAFVAPALQIAFMLVITAGALARRTPRWVGTLLRWHPFLTTWSTIEVMLLGVLVALTKIADYATVIPGLALFTLGALVVLLAATQSCFDPREVWRRVEWVDEEARRAVAGEGVARVTT